MVGIDTQSEIQWSDVRNQFFAVAAGIPIVILKIFYILIKIDICRRFNFIESWHISWWVYQFLRVFSPTCGLMAHMRESF